jgi:hypothetical protein
LGDIECDYVMEYFYEKQASTPSKGI